LQNRSSGVEWLDRNSSTSKHYDIDISIVHATIYAINSRKELHSVCPMLASNCIFALDHTNYGRWLPVHISDMVNLPSNHPEIYRQFEKGHFAVQKTKNVFSASVINQCHEQVNELIKGDGGAVELTDSPQVLKGVWLPAGVIKCRTWIWKELPNG